MDKKTRVVVEAEPKGFEKAAAQASKLKEAANLKDVDKAARGFEKTAEGVERILRRLAAASKAFGESFDVGEATKELAALQKQLAALATSMGGGGSGNKGTFLRGLAQGLGAAQYLPNNQNLGANLAGQGVGRFVRGVGGGLASTPFQGAQGLASGLSAVPFVGGVAGGMLSNALGMTGDYLGYAGQLQGLRALSSVRGIDTSKYRDDVEAAQVLAAARSYDGAMARPQRSPAELAQLTRENPSFRPSRFEGDAGDVAGLPLGTLEDAWREDLAREVEGRSKHAQGRAPAAMARAKAEAEAVALSRARRDSVAVDPSQWGGIGLTYGQSLPETLQSIQAALGTSGTSADKMSSSMLRMMLGAKAGFGVTEDVAGAFMRGSSSGAISGAPEVALERAIQAGFKAGLEGSDIPNYLRTTASMLMEFDRTGMPLDVDAMGSFQQKLAEGFGGKRAGALAEGFLAMGRGGLGSMSQQKLMAMQELVGFGSGNDFSLDALERAQARMESGDFDGGGIERLVSRFAGSGKNALLAQNNLSQLGINVGVREIREYLDGARKTLSDVPGFSVAERGAAAVDGNVRAAKGLENARVGTGGQLIGAAQNFEAAMTKSAGSAAQFQQQIDSVASAAALAAQKFNEIAEAMAAAINTLNFSGGGGK